MNNALSRSTVELRKYRLMVSYFVGLFMPFVGYVNSIFIPFVCKKIPNGTIQVTTGRIQGFTLIELMVALAVVAILAMVAVPNMRTIIQSNRITTQVNSLLSDVNLARSEAARGAINVQICTWNSVANPSNPACDGGNNWSRGWVICADRDNNGVFCGATELVRSREGLAATTLTPNAPNAAISSITFNTRGQPGTGVVDFRLCDFRGTAFAKSIRISATGQASVPPPAVLPVPACP